MIEIDVDSRPMDFLKRLKKSQPKHYRQIARRIDILRRFANPPHAAKVRVKDGSETWRIPSGEYRIIYQDQADGARYIKEINKRNDGVVYRKFSRSR